uniref:F-box domain-containing protein n=1 Tax=Steinernema glaseri TaxID=37863 RepID=A0A1I8AIW2_9BILA
MDSVPQLFVEALCTSLKHCDLWTLRRIRKWTTTAAIHWRKARTLFVYLQVNNEGTEVAIGIPARLYDYAPFVVYAKYDKIKRIKIGVNNFEDLPQKISMECFKRKVIPLIQSMAFKCSLENPAGGSQHQNLEDCIFHGLRDCAQLREIKTSNRGESCPEFIERQVALGNVEELALLSDQIWPDRTQASIRSFVKSPRFKYLDITNSNLRLDFDMVACIVDTYAKVVLYKGTSISGMISFPLQRLNSVHEELLKRRLSDKPKPGDKMIWARFFGSMLIVTMTTNTYIYIGCDDDKCRSM